MAVKKIQMRPPDNDYADVLHPETDTTMVLLPDGSVLQDQLVAPLASGSATELVIDMPGITSYTHLKLFQFIASANNNGAATTLKVGTLPARPIYLEGTVDTAPNLIAGRLYTVWADNTENCFFLKASGSGNAVAADLLAGKTATTDNGPITGTMPNNGSQDATLTIIGSAKPTKVIPEGYTPGGTIIAQLDSSFASSIKSGITIGGVTGTLKEALYYTNSFSQGYGHNSINASFDCPFVPTILVAEVSLSIRPNSTSEYRQYYCQFRRIDTSFSHGYFGHIDKMLISQYGVDSPIINTTADGYGRTGNAFVSYDSWTGQIKVNYSTTRAIVEWPNYGCRGVMSCEVWAYKFR